MNVSYSANDIVVLYFVNAICLFIQGLDYESVQSLQYAADAANRSRRVRLSGPM